MSNKVYITKSDPTITRDGGIMENVVIKNGVLWINDRYKYDNKRWYFLGDDQKLYFLGFGANPDIRVADENVVDRDLFAAVFEEVQE